MLTGALAALRLVVDPAFDGSEVTGRSEAGERLMLNSRLLKKKMEDYKGLHCGCPPGTHAALVRTICRHVAPCSGVLDIGAHAGALLLRLRDRGFADLVGTDLDATRFDLPGAEFVRLELNQPFASKFDRKFNLITSTDVIEHLDSPLNLLSQVWALLEEGGRVAISFPNVALWEGRIRFLLKGELWGFEARNYRLQRHISPITFEQMQCMMQETGFDLVEAGTGGSFGTVLREVLGFPIWGPLRLLLGPSVCGESALFLCKKGDPDPELKAPLHYRKRWGGLPDRIGLDD